MSETKATDVKATEAFLPIGQALKVMFGSLDWESEKPTEVSRIYIRNRGGNVYRVIKQDHCVSFQKKQPHQQFFHDIGVIPEGKYRVFFPSTHSTLQTTDTAALKKLYHQTEELLGKIGGLANVN